MLSISVIIPTYNRIDVLPRALDSVFSQSDLLTDVIVVDDGSDDGTADMVSAKYPEVKLIKQQNTGVSAARNRGIAESKGGWIAFLDSDDEWKPQKLERQIICIAENPDAVLVHTNEIWIRDGKRVNPMNKHQKYGGRIFWKCLPLCVISPSSVMVKRSLFDEVGNFDENMEVCEDYDLWLRICASNQVHYIDEKLIVKYGGHSDQLSAKHWWMDRFRIEALKKIIAQRNLSKEDKRSAVHMLVEKANIVASGAQKRGNTSLFECYNNLADEYGRKFVDWHDRRPLDSDMGESREFHLPSDEHGGMESGTKVTLSKDHREFGEEVSAGTKLVVDAIVHFPTRYRLQDDSGKIWTVPVHSIDIASDQKEADSEPASEEK